VRSGPRLPSADPLSPAAHPGAPPAAWAREADRVNDAAVALFTKPPLAGRVKTRLVPPLTHEDAARVARASLEDTARFIVPEVAAPRTLFLYGGPDAATRALAEETGLSILPQEGPELGARLKAAFRALRDRGA